MIAESIFDAAERAAKKDGNYTIRDGIAYCNNCGEPRQIKTDLGFGETIVWCACKCQEEKAGTDNAERIERLQTLGGVSSRCVFAEADLSTEVAVCKEYAESWDDAAKIGAGLLLWGGVGTGKTFAAHCIANDLIKREIPVYITSLARVINSGFDKTEVLSRVRETPLVVFDDLGAERSSEYARETVFLLVDERYRSKKPLVVTTNLSLDEMKNPGNIDCKRIYDRILGRCAPVRFGGESKREQEAESIKQFARELYRRAKK